MPLFAPNPNSRVREFIESLLNALDEDELYVMDLSEKTAESVKSQIAEAALKDDWEGARAIKDTIGETLAAYQKDTAFYQSWRDSIRNGLVRWDGAYFSTPPRTPEPPEKPQEVKSEAIPVIVETAEPKPRKKPDPYNKRSHAQLANHIYSICRTMARHKSGICSTDALIRAMEREDPDCASWMKASGAPTQMRRILQRRGLCTGSEHTWVLTPKGFDVAADGVFPLEKLRQDSARYIHQAQQAHQGH